MPEPKNITPVQLFIEEENDSPVRLVRWDDAPAQDAAEPALDAEPADDAGEPTEPVSEPQTDAGEAASPGVGKE